jgi:hypothetical protein
VKRTSKFKPGDRVTVAKVPTGVPSRKGLDTLTMFRRSLGKIFRVEGIDEHGHLELVVDERSPSPDKYESDTIWIEPECVVLANKPRGGK